MANSRGRSRTKRNSRGQFQGRRRNPSRTARDEGPGVPRRYRNSAGQYTSLSNDNYDRSISSSASFRNNPVNRNWQELAGAGLSVLGGLLGSDLLGRVAQRAAPTSPSAATITQGVVTAGLLFGGMMVQSDRTSEMLLLAGLGSGAALVAELLTSKVLPSVAPGYYPAGIGVGDTSIPAFRFGPLQPFFSCSPWVILSSFIELKTTNG